MTNTFINEPVRKTRVDYNVDVAVVGGGTAGCIAAIAAARAGASVALIERFGAIGGCATTGRCFHIGNLLYDGEGNQLIDGIPAEVIRRVAAEGGTQYEDLEEIVFGKGTKPLFFLMDPEILNMVLMEMVQEAGVKLMLHTYFCDPIMDGENKIKGVIAQNKSGRFAVMAKNVIDASGEGDVAFDAGVPCNSSEYLDWLKTYGLLFRIGNVDVEKFMEYTLNLPAGEPRPEFDEWLPKQTGRDIEDLRKDWYWHHFLDPQPGGWGVPGDDPEKTVFSKDTLEWFKKRWESDGDFAYVGIHFFRELIKKAVDNGDFEFISEVDDIAHIGYNYDGITGGKWRNGEVLINVICPRPGFDAFNTDHVAQMEVASRKRALELARFFKKYMPGFESSYMIDTGYQTLPRHIRFVESEFGLTEEVEVEKHLMELEEVEDVIFMAPVEMVGKKALKLPYKMLLPKKVDNLIVAGKCVAGSVLVRGIPLIMAMGQAAGVAAAIASKENVTPKQLDVKTLQKELEEQKVILSLDK